MLENVQLTRVSNIRALDQNNCLGFSTQEKLIILIILFNNFIFLIILKLIILL